MELTCYLHEGWKPFVRPAPPTRRWMDETPLSFAYRCLPLNIANAHGWEVLSPTGFEAIWDGGHTPGAVTLKLDPDTAAERAPISLFGQGVLTFHIDGVFRTPPGWNLWISGSPNRQKDAIQPLSAIVETDWSPFTFTMNWRFTRPGRWIRFEAMEPICFLFPVRRGALEAFEPRFAPMEADPALLQRFQEWSRSCDAFQAEARTKSPARPGAQWQKHYYRGVDLSGERLVNDHQARLRLRPFDRSSTPEAPQAPLEDAAAAPSPPQVDEESARVRLALKKREWLLETLEKQRDLSPAAIGIERRANLSSEEFLDRYYALNRPVILTGEMDDWPALRLWTPEHLKHRVGDALVEYQGGRSADPRFEIEKDAHRRTAPFSALIDRMLANPDANDDYITAYNAAGNSALDVLADEMGALETFLDPTLPASGGMLWIGPAGTVTSLHHDLTNNLVAQVVGRKQLTLFPPSEVGKLYNHRHVFSEIADLEPLAERLVRYPRLGQARAYPILLQPGEVIFIPLAWWHEVRALDFSVSATFTNFRWPNDAAASYPDR